MIGLHIGYTFVRKLFHNLLRFRFVVSYRRDQLHLSKGSREHYVSISIPDQNIYLVQSKSNVDSLVDSSPSFIQTSSQASSKNVSVVANAWSIEGKDWSIDHESSKTVPIRTIDLPSSIEDDQNPHQRITPPLVNKLSKALQVSLICLVRTGEVLEIGLPGSNEENGELNTHESFDVTATCTTRSHLFTAKPSMDAPVIVIPVEGELAFENIFNTFATFIIPHHSQSFSSSQLLITFQIFPSLSRQQDLFPWRF